MNHAHVPQYSADARKVYENLGLTDILDQVDAQEAAEAAHFAALGPDREKMYHVLSQPGQFSAAEQLEAGAGMWNELGLPVPTLTENQVTAIQSQLEARPNSLVIAVPLLTEMQRREVFERARAAFPQHPEYSFQASAQALVNMAAGSVYGKLLADPTVVAEQDGMRFASRYHVDGQILDRPEYLGYLRESGSVVEDQNGQSWMFPVLDARPTPASDRTAAELSVSSGAMLPTDTLLALALSQQAGGVLTDTNYISNEAIYSIDANGTPGEMELVVGVLVDARREQVDLGTWGPTLAGEFTPLDTKSGV